MSLAADDLAAMMADTTLTVPVALGASTTRGYFDWKQVVEKDTSGFDVFVNRRTVAVAAGSLAGLANDAAVVVDGTTYHVHDFTREDDGAIITIILAPLP